VGWKQTGRNILLNLNILKFLGIAETMWKRNTPGLIKEENIGHGRIWSLRGVLALRESVLMLIFIYLFIFFCFRK